MKRSIFSRLRNIYCKPCGQKSGIYQKKLLNESNLYLCGIGRLCHTEIPSNMTEDSVLQGLDEVQVNLMREKCILVDKDDRNKGWASKKDCHLLNNINKGMLHRAFSVFLFNNNGHLLLQQRSDSKITFPGHFTNTCCSHPLYTERELEEKNAMGIKNAAQRRLHQELGIQPHQIDIADFHYLTRIHYKSGNVPEDGVWGEHEIDYILVVQKDVSLSPNPEEVKTCKYVNKEELQKLVDEASSSGTLITPWFRLIHDKFLYTWWDNLNNLSAHTDHDQIHHMLD